MRKSISVKLYHIRYKFDGDSYPHEMMSKSAEQPLWISGQRRELLIWQVTPVTRYVEVGDFVKVHTFGAWRRGHVVDVAKTRAQVEYPTNKATPHVKRRKWYPANELQTFRMDMEGHDL